MNFVRKNWSGIGLCLAIALPTWLLVRLLPPFEVIGAPVLAILAGMVVTRFLTRREAFSAGISYTSKKVLQYAVILLGFGLNLATVGKVGLTSLPIIVSTITTSLVTAYLMHRLLHVPGNISTLVGVGSSICGGSAIAATAPVIDASDAEVAQSISVIFLFNVIAAVIFPSLGSLLGLTDNGFALFAGTAVNDTSSVTAAASTWDTLHATGGTVLESATIVKLTRTLAILPITLVLAFFRMHKAKISGGETEETICLGQIFPMFILYFVLASLLTTILSALCSGTALTAVHSVFAFFKQLSKFFIVMAMAAIGLNTDLVKLVKTGGKPIALGFVCWIAIALVSLLLQHILGIF